MYRDYRDTLAVQMLRKLGVFWEHEALENHMDKNMTAFVRDVVGCRFTVLIGFGVQVENVQS